MMTTLYFAVLLAVASVRANAFARYRFPGYGGMNNNMGMQPRCQSVNRPCKMKVNVSTGDFTNQASSELCSCATPKTCSSDWGNRDHVISRRLRTPSNIRITVNMMFCDAVLPLGVCSPGQVALVVSGYSLIPRAVEEVSCRCPDRYPLVLHERRVGPDHKQYDSYICRSHTELCQPTSACLVNDYLSSTTVYPCKCRRGSSCGSLLGLAGPFLCRSD